MSGKDVIYRVTFDNGETCHTGYRPLAEVWAKRSGAVLEEIGLEVPTEQHEATFRWRLLPQLRKLASDFISHPLSRGISECEQAGEAMREAAIDIERLCRTRNAVISTHARTVRRVKELEDQIAAMKKHSTVVRVCPICAGSMIEIDEMSAIADRYAHRMAMHLECIMYDYSGKFYNEAMQTLGEYRSAMNAIHERVSPTFMGEPVLPKDAP